MKINRNEVDKLYNSINMNSAPARDKEQNRTIGTEKDSLVISDEAKNHTGIGGIVKQAVNEVTKPAASDKLLRIKNEIANGTYHVSGSSIASAMLGYEDRSDDQ